MYFKIIKEIEYQNTKYCYVFLGENKYSYFKIKEDNEMRIYDEINDKALIANLSELL